MSAELPDVSCDHFETLQKKERKDKKSKTFMRLQNLSLFPRERGSVSEAIAYCVSLLPANSKVALFSFHQTLPLYFCSASVDREPRFWPHLSFRSLPHPLGVSWHFSSPPSVCRGSPIPHPPPFPAGPLGPPRRQTGWGWGGR